LTFFGLFVQKLCDHGVNFGSFEQRGESSGAGVQKSARRTPRRDPITTGNALSILLPPMYSPGVDFTNQFWTKNFQTNFCALEIRTKF
jgi:hypothetical protein